MMSKILKASSVFMSNPMPTREALNNRKDDEDGQGRPFKWYGAESE